MKKLQCFGFRLGPRSDDLGHIMASWPGKPRGRCCSVLCLTNSPDIFGVQMFQMFHILLSPTLTPSDKSASSKRVRRAPVQLPATVTITNAAAEMEGKKTKELGEASLPLTKMTRKGNPQIFMQKIDPWFSALVAKKLKTHQTPSQQSTTNHQKRQQTTLAFQTWRQSHVTQRHRSTRSLLPGKGKFRPSHPYYSKYCWWFRNPKADHLGWC